MKSNDERIEQIAAEVGHVSQADHILNWDRKQSVKGAIQCQNRDHGGLLIHGRGHALVCGKCEYTYPVSRS